MTKSDSTKNFTFCYFTLFENCDYSNYISHKQIIDPKKKTKLKNMKITPPLAELRISYGATHFARIPIRRVVGFK